MSVNSPAVGLWTPPIPPRCVVVLEEIPPGSMLMAFGPDILLVSPLQVPRKVTPAGLVPVQVIGRDEVRHG